MTGIGQPAHNCNTNLYKSITILGHQNTNLLSKWANFMELQRYSGLIENFSEDRFAISIVILFNPQEYSRVQALLFA